MGLTRDATEALLSNQRRTLLRIILARRVPPQDAEDILQLLYERFWNHHAQARNAMGFLVAAATNLCRNYHRDGQRQRELLRRFLSQTRASPPPATSTEVNMVRTLDLREALAVVGKKCARLLMTFVVRQVAYTDHAHDTGIPRGTLGPAVLRCLRKMRHYLIERGYDSLIKRRRHADNA